MVNGEVVEIQDREQIKATYKGNGKPVILLVAKWKKAYDVISFNVAGETYCDVLVDKGNPVLEYPPEAPHFSSGYGYEFMDWDMLEGMRLPAIDETPNVDIMCGTGEGQVLCHGPWVAGDVVDVDYGM
jgi:hypothetical protein